MTPLYTLEQGKGALLINVPHAGTFVPPELHTRFTGLATGLPDTDWFVDRLYGFARALGAGLLIASHSRYVIDLNRPANDESLYATHTTGLLPLETFAGEAVYRPGQEPIKVEQGRRVEQYWQPYHQALLDELLRIRQRHGHAVLLDAHSIRSELPLLFDGLLPDLNLGSFGGASAHAGLVRGAMVVLGSDNRWTSVLDGRFQGGFITRHYGRPAEGLHALQLEMAQSAYMRESEPVCRPELMKPVQTLLRSLVLLMLEWRPGHDG